MIRFTRILALFALALLVSCDDDTVGSGGGGRARPTLQNIWPSTDGSEWTYSLSMGALNTYDHDRYDTPEDAPEQPEMAQIIAAVSALALDDPEALLGDYTVRFEGEGTTASGAVGKQIVSEIDIPDPPASMTKMLSSGPFDLPALSPLLKTDEFERIPNILLISDGVWAETKDYIGYHNEADTAVRLKLALRDLSEGIYWTSQTAPSIAPFVWLHAQVVGAVDVVTPAGIFENTVRIVYAFDTGVLDERTPYLGEGPYIRLLSYAVVDYAPTVGPVRFVEARSAIEKDEQGNPVILAPFFVYEALLETYRIGS